ncbi:hypothetical protein NW754_011327 [Fusarium falciforme]|nr:hypothetical protein NW754_011327 [Fusarium falciforme]
MATQNGEPSDPTPSYIASEGSVLYANRVLYTRIAETTARKVVQDFMSPNQERKSLVCFRRTHLPHQHARRSSGRRFKYLESAEPKGEVLGKQDEAVACHPRVYFRQAMESLALFAADGHNFIKVIIIAFAATAGLSWKIIKRTPFHRSEDVDLVSGLQFFNALTEHYRQEREGAPATVKDKLLAKLF